MNILLDECVPRRLSRYLKGHNVKTTPEMGWAGRKNGALLSLAQTHFDLFITVDRNLSFQQHLPRFKIGVLLLSAPSNNLVDLVPLTPKILAAIASVQPGKVVSIGA